MDSRVAQRLGPEEGLPSTVEDYWVYAYHPNPTFSENHLPTTDVIDHGKWMLFYPKEDMDARWQEARENMCASRFGIVESMKASTFRENPRSSDHSKGVIILYTPDASKEAIRGYSVTMFFKTWKQTLDGTAATGRSKNHTFYIRPQLRYQDVFADESFP